MNMSFIRDSEGNIDVVLVGLLIGLFITTFVALPLSIIDERFMKPTAAANANEYCKANGFDQYKEYQRIGLLSSTPVAIKCEYAEKYTDLGVRTTQSN